MQDLEALKKLEEAEESLKALLNATPATISIGEKNSQDLVGDALEEVQFAIRCLLMMH